MADTQTSAPTVATADPAPLGLVGFAATTLVLSVTNAGLVSPTVVYAVLPLALFYGGLAQFVAGIIEFRRGNTFGATAFPTYGAFWMAYAFFVWFFAGKITDASGKVDVTATNEAVGMFLLVFAIVTAYLTIAAIRTSGAVLAVFTALTLTFVFLCIGAFADSKGINHIGGWIGIITAILAFYTSFAEVTNATWKRQVLPTFPMAPAVS